MGRAVIEQKTGEFVWKYVFAEQGSEQSQIAEGLGIGKVEYPKDANYDVLVLKQSDRVRLEDYLNEPYVLAIGNEKYGQMTNDFKPVTRNKLIRLWRKVNKTMFGNGIALGSVEEGIRNTLRSVMPEIHFWQMIKAYADFMKKHKDQKEFRFEGEY